MTKEKRVTISIRIRPSVLKKIDAIKNKRGRTRSAIMEMAAEAGLSALKEAGL